MIGNYMARHGWVIDKKISISVIIAFLSICIGGLWQAAKLGAGYEELRITTEQTTIAITALSDRMSRSEERAISIKESLNRIENNLRSK